MSGLARIAVMGAGAWGTALALAALSAGREVWLWARRPEQVAAMQLNRENALHLPGVALPTSLRITADPAQALACDAALLAIPAQNLRATLPAFAPLLKPDLPLVICAKGIEQSSGKLMTEVLAELLPGQPLAVLSGPNFAAEIARGLPAATTIAAVDPSLAHSLVEALGSSRFRPYASGDPLGAQVGGALKNVLAIACGIVAGRRLGENARAALITRGLSEMVRLGLALGAQRETLMGLSGLGDLTLTCTGNQSRNYSLGLALGEGRALGEILAGRQSVSEGVHSAAAARALAERHGLDLPITAAVDAILNQGAAIEAAIEGLLARPFKSENV